MNELARGSVDDDLHAVCKGDQFFFPPFDLGSSSSRALSKSSVTRQVKARRRSAPIQPTAALLGKTGSLSPSFGFLAVPEFEGRSHKNGSERSKCALTAPTSPRGSPCMKRARSASSLRGHKTDNDTCSQSSILSSQSAAADILHLPGLKDLPLDDFVEPELIQLETADLDSSHIVVGSGGQARIFRAEINGEIVAVKVSCDCSILQEYSLVRLLEHPDIVRPVAFSIITDEHSAKTFDTARAAAESEGSASSASHSAASTLYAESTAGETPFIFMACYEYAEQGDLASFLSKHSRRTSDQRFMSRLCNSLLSALHHLHVRGYIHGDLKPENILVTADEKIKLADFGMCQRICNNMVPQGTPSYLAPEIVASWFDSDVSGATFTGAADIFAFGVMLINVLTKKYPFRRITARLNLGGGESLSKEEIRNIFQAPIRAVRELDSTAPKFAEISRRCLEFLPEDRPSAKDLKKILAELSFSQQGFFGRSLPSSSGLSGLFDLT